MRYSFILIGILVVAPGSLFCQNIFGDSSRPKHLIVGLGSSFGEWATGEVSAMLSEGAWVGPCVPNYGYCGPRASLEFSASPQGSTFIAPKISYEANFIILGGRVGFADYTNFRTHEICFVPEVGLTFFGMLDCYVGYNIPLTKARLEKIQSLKLTVTLNWDTSSRLF